MAASIGSATKAEEDEVFTTLPELSTLASVGSFAPASPTTDETICKVDVMVCNAQSSAEGSPRLLHFERDTQLLDQEFTPCNGVASIPGIPSELESLGATGMPLPPMVDSVTNHMFKVSISQALGNTGEHLHHYRLVNGEIGLTEEHEMIMVVTANDDDGGDASLKKADVEPKPLFRNSHASIVINSETGHTEHHEMSMVIPTNDDEGEEGFVEKADVESKPLSGNTHATIVINGESGHTEHHEMSTVIPANDCDGGDVSVEKAVVEPKPVSSNMPAAIVINGESGLSEHHETSKIIHANDGDGGDVSLKKVDIEPKPLSSHTHAAIAISDAPSLQMNNCKMGVDSCKDGMPRSFIKGAVELGTNNDDDNDSIDDVDDDVDDDDDDDYEEEEEGEEADDSGVDIEDGEEVNDRKSQVEQESDSSSSTSSLSFLSSSDDDDEVSNLHHLLNGANNQNDLVMEVESECEEGELKESPSQRKNGSLKKRAMNESSEDEEGLKVPVQSRNKMKDLPYVPKVSVTLEHYHKTVPVGFVSSVVGVSLIVEGIEGRQPLNEGSILWLTEQRLPLGIVDELFGPVKKPFYVVRYNDTTEMPEEAKEGALVSYVRDFADFVLNNPDLYSKGYDESGDVDISDSEVDFSDDEKEAEYKRSKTRMKRGNSETSAFEVDNRQHQERRAEGMRLNKDRNRRSKGENARTFHSTHKEFSGRPPRHQNGRFQHHRNEREPSFGNRVEPMQTSNERNKHRCGNQSPLRQAQSQQSRLSKSSTPGSPTSDSWVPTQSQAQPLKMNKLQSTSSPNLQEPTLTNQLCSTSQPIQTNQLQHSTSQQGQSLEVNQPGSFTQPTSQQVQLVHLNQPHNLVQSPSQQIQMNQPHGLMQSSLPQVRPWQVNQQQIPPQQLPGIQHSPVYSHTVVAGQVPQVAIGGYSIPLANKPSLQPGPDTVQGLPPAYQSPIFQQQAPTLNQCSSSMPHHFSGQGSQLPPNMGMPIGNPIQAVHANGYPLGGQPTTLTAPVLGIPAGPANTPFNYSMQMVCNQNFPGFTPAFVNQSLSSTYGVPEQARAMQPMAPASWQQQQHSPQDSSGPWPQQPSHHRPHQMRGPYQGRRS